MPRQKILEAAFELFSKGTYNSVTLSQIAQKVGIKKPSIYSHFASKEALFLEVLSHEINRVYDQLDKIISDTRGFETKVILHRLLMESSTYISSNPPVGGFWSYLLFITQNDLSEQVTLSISELKRYIDSLLFQIIQTGIDKGDLIKQDTDGIFYSYCCLFQGNLLMELNSKTFHISMVNKSWDYFWDGVKSKV